MSLWLCNVALMKSYTLPRATRKLRTSATRRYLVVSVYGGRPKVEASTDDENAAAKLIARYRRTFGPQGELFLLDQSGQGG